jgi:protein TIF31
MAGHDLRGLGLVNSLDIKEVHSLQTALVDYRGERIVCQSIIPGIFNGDRASRHIYGSMVHCFYTTPKHLLHKFKKKSFFF